jgi:CheY-like chemotaxis protein
LEDLPLIDMLQIVAFSQKTGYLQIDGPRGRGGIVFNEGLVVCAYSWSTLKYLRQLGEDLQGAHNVSILRKQIEISLRELAGLKEGVFHFQVTDSIPTELEGMPVAPFVIEQGINPEGLLLDLAKDFDEERKETSDLLRSPEPLESSSAPVSSETGSAARESSEDEAVDPEDISEDPSTDEMPVLLVDDEQPVRDILGQVLRDHGYRVYVATGPAEAMGMASEIALSGQRFLVVTDLSMPTTTGRSFRGGLELAKAIKKNDYDAPVLLIAEKLSPKVRSRAKSFGIRRIALKPALSKLDAEAYETDLRVFGAAVIRFLKDLETTETIEEDDGSVQQPVAEGSNTTPFLDYIASMTEHLLDPKRSVDVSQLVLQVASKYLERGVLFLIKEQRACGIGGFGFVSTEQASVEVAQTISFNVDQAPPFGEVSYSGKTERFSAEVDCFQSCIYSVIGRARATECILIPMLSNSEVLVILFGDNAASGRPIGKLRGLELFIGQAGVTLENTYLHSKLRAFEAKLARIDRAPP